MDIYKKMNEVMKDIGAIGKDQTNKQQGYKFRGIDDMLNSLYPVFCKHGVFMTFEVLEFVTELKEVERKDGRNGIDKHVHLKIKYNFMATDGSSVSTIVVSEGLDSGDKATNKALSAGLKYALIQTFCVPTQDMVDGDADSPVIEKPKQQTSNGFKKTVKEEPKPQTKKTEVKEEEQENTDVAATSDDTKDETVKEKSTTEAPRRGFLRKAKQ